MKNLTDWLQAVGSVASVVIAIILGVVSCQAQTTAEDNQKHEILSQYYQIMADLSLDGKSLVSSENTVDGKSKRSIGLAMTLSTFRQLDGRRKGEMLKFLYQADLIQSCDFIEGSCKPKSSTFQLGKVDLNKAKIDPEWRLNLSGVNLSQASLNNADLREIDLKENEPR
jgi:hypothetical protein